MFFYYQVEIDRRDYARKLVHVLNNFSFRSLGKGRIRARLEKPEHLAPLCKIKVSGLATDGVGMDQQTLYTIFVDDFKARGVEDVSIKDENVGFVLFDTPQLARKALEHDGKYALQLNAVKPRRIPTENVERTDGQRIGGVVSSWGRGFGMITPDDGGEDVFVHHSSIEDGRDLAEDSRVEFTLCYNDDRWRAERLTGGITKGLLHV